MKGQKQIRLFLGGTHRYLLVELSFKVVIKLGNSLGILTVKADTGVKASSVLH